MSANEKIGLKQKFNIKCSVDLIVFVFIFALFLILAIQKIPNSYESIAYLTALLVLFVPAHFITKIWVYNAIKETLTFQTNSIAKFSGEINENLESQKKTIESLLISSKNLSSLIEKLKELSKDVTVTSKNTEKQVNQSISCSQKEQDAISTNVEKMLVLRQKIQMIAELILELSEHTQQIGNTISVVDDIAEQTNMLALNAAVEAARAGEHGKGFAVVAGEIRKLADESKQAITKITSLTSNIQYTTNSTVMATEEGSKEIENVVKDINSVSANSENLHSLIETALESLESLNQQAIKQNDIIEKLNAIDEESKKITEELAKFISVNTEKFTKFNGSLKY